MKKFIFLLLLVPILILDFGCNNNSTEPNDNDTTTVIARKPNLYIYPEEKISLSIELVFPKGGTVIESIPEYNNQWEITVEPSGKINNSFDYLFYECEIPNLTQTKVGWLIEKRNLEDFFVNNLSNSGFNQREISDFNEYWIPLLSNYDYYAIYPQYKSDLDKIVTIYFSEEPNNFYRLFYLIIGRDDNNLEIEKPVLESAVRENYFAVEWGVILK
jgi:hypothetical protein